MNRKEDVENFLMSDHVWPPTVQANPKHPFMQAIKEVLVRLPDDVFDEVDLSLQFVIQEDDILAVNVPYKWSIGGTVLNPSYRLDTICIYKQAFLYSHKALQALLAHEIAHSFVNERNYCDDESEVDKLIVEWGFKEELDEFHGTTNSNK